MIAIAIVGLATISNAQAPNYVPTNGLVGWWPFTGNANDESGNGNNCTIFNGPVLCPDRFGAINSAYLLDGVDDWIETNTSFLQTDNPHSISMWWKSTDSTKTNQTLFNTSPHTLENSAFHYSSSSSTPPYGMSFGMGNGLSGGGSWNIMHPDVGQITTPPTLGQWHQYVWVKDASLNWTFYFNGVLINTFNSVTNTGSQIANLRFGAENDGVPTGGANFLGNLDDIGIWNRALTQLEITNLYNAANCTNNTAITPQINSLTAGSTATFTASTTDPNPTYVWQSDLGQGFQTLNNFGNYSGVNTASLNVTNVQLSEHNQPIRVISTSGNCIDTSNVAGINILDTCITNVTIYDTILTTVTDTLIINATITGLNPPSNQNTLKVFPNPANTHITIDYGNFSSMNGYTLKIVNATGQTVFTTFINQQNSYIDLSTWTGNGIYYVQLIDTQNNTIENRKIVIH